MENSARTEIPLPSVCPVGAGRYIWEIGGREPVAFRFRVWILFQGGSGACFGGDYRRLWGEIGRWLSVGVPLWEGPVCGSGRDIVIPISSGLSTVIRQLSTGALR